MLALTAALELSQETKPNSEPKKTGDQIVKSGVWNSHHRGLKLWSARY